MNKKSELKKVNKKSDDVFVNELEKFKAIFPQFVKENKNKDGEIFSEIDFDSFQSFLDKNQDSDEDSEKYSFTWSGRKKSFKNISEPSLGTLKPKKEDSVDFENTENIFIEGDNLEVLKLLQKNYRGKIKMIYIDPPYNTGKDFVYKDNFSEGKSDYYEKTGITKDGVKMETNSGDSGRYHSNWLSMMYPRLFLAKQLLKDDGVIFVSIDDNEQYHLRMLMNEIFGEENFVANIIWEKNFAPKNDNKYISISHEYIYLFAKNKEKFNRILLPREKKHNKDYKNPDNDKRGDWTSGTMLATTYNENYVFGIERPNNTKIFPPKGRCWRYSKNKIKSLEKDNRIWFGKDGNNVPRIKRFLSEMPDGIVPQSIWKYSDVGSSSTGTADVKKIFNESQYFDFPKSVELLKRILFLSTKNNDIILDFFAGSATTGHAVMDLNKEDNEKEKGSGKRKFILVQIPEDVDEKSEAFKAGYKNIAEISKDRLRKAIEKNDYKEGFKVFALDSSNYNFWQDYDGEDEEELKKQMKLAIENPLKKGWKEEDLVYEILLKEGFSLNSVVKKEKSFWVVEDTEREQKIFIDFSKKIDNKNIEKMKMEKDNIFVCFDSALENSQKINLGRNFNLRVI